MGVVGEAAGISLREIAGLRVEFVSESPRAGRSVRESPRTGLSVRESPRAGRSTCWFELYEELDVTGESSCADCESSGIGDAVKEESSGGLVNRPALSVLTELCEGDRISDFEFFLASAFLFFGTSCSLNASVDCDAEGEAWWLRDRSLARDGDS